MNTSKQDLLIIGYLHDLAFRKPVTMKGIMAQNILADYEILDISIMESLTSYIEVLESPYQEESEEFTNMVKNPLKREGYIIKKGEFGYEREDELLAVDVSLRTLQEIQDEISRL